jgi:catechol 2,3-dioxygenase-like lactoylglutathione lyase family enzyme
MILGVQDIYYYVQDMGRALRFYRDTLSLRVTEEDEHWSALDVGGVRVGLHGTDEGRPVPPVPKDAGGTQAGGTLTLRVADIRAEVARLRAAGVKFLGEIYNADWGSTVAFEDPDGNVLKLMQPPGS